jgi:hypothetical protein
MLLRVGQFQALARDNNNSPVLAGPSHAGEHVRFSE